MADIGLGQLITTTGRLRSKKAKDAVTDNHPWLSIMKQLGGIKRVDGGRTVLDEALSGQNSTVAWVGEAGQVSLQDYRVVDSPEYNWAYLLGAITWTLAEEYKNGGGSDTKFINIVGAKIDALEASMKNTFHDGLNSTGTGTSGLQLDGVPALVSTTPTTGTVGGIDRSNSNAAWFRNQKFDTANDWSDGATSSANITRLLDKGLNATTRDGRPQIDVFNMGSTHYEFLGLAIRAIQVIQNENEVGKAGFNKLVYRGTPCFLAGGINFSGITQQTATRTYGLNLKDGGVNLVYHEKAEFEMLAPVNSSDQAARSRLMFTMATLKVGAFSKFNWVLFD